MNLEERMRIRMSFGAMLFLCAFMATAAASATNLSVIDNHAFYPEGPLWWHGRLYFAEYEGNDVKVVSHGKISVFWKELHCGPDAVIPFGRNSLLVACYSGDYLAILNADGKELRVIKRTQDGKVFDGPNDVTPDRHGGIYFTASGKYDIHAPITGKVLHLAAGARVATVVARLIDYSNGLTLTKSGRHLLVAEMLADRILSFQVLPHDKLGARTVWARLQDLAAPTPGEGPYNGPDGVKLGPDGNYYIAQNGSGRVLVVTGDKKLVRIISVPTRNVTNIAFGPASSSGAKFTVFITGVFNQWKPPYFGAVYSWTGK